jgi:hypothetical protein
MKTYSAYVYGGVGRRVLVEAESPEEAEAKAIEEFVALLGADREDVGVEEIEEMEDV